MSDTCGRTMRILKHIVSYNPDADFYVFTDGEFLFHGLKFHNFENTFEQTAHEHPMEITKTPWHLFAITRDTNDNPNIWIFKRENEITEEIIMLREINRMKIKELKQDE